MRKIQSLLQNPKGELMNKFKSRSLQKMFLPLAAFCIIPIWLILRQGTSPSLGIYLLSLLGFIFFLLDRILKPWELDRAEKQLKKSNQNKNR